MPTEGFRAPIKSRAMQIVERRLGAPLEQWIAERYEAGATQEEIGVELGIEGATVSRWMRELGIEARFPGQRKPSDSTAESAA
jgi:hypothetical protein